MNEQTFVLKGTICYSNSLTELSITENGYLVCEDGRDVYKRQNLNSNLFLFGISSHDRLRRLSTSLQRTIPVSYTHLDVYKRQGLQ